MEEIEEVEAKEATEITMERTLEEMDEMAEDVMVFVPRCLYFLREIEDAIDTMKESM
jgi:hypothetical protein